MAAGVWSPWDRACCCREVLTDSLLARDGLQTHYGGDDGLLEGALVSVGRQEHVNIVSVGACQKRTESVAFA